MTNHLRLGLVLGLSSVFFACKSGADRAAAVEALCGFSRGLAEAGELKEPALSGPESAGKIDAALRDNLRLVLQSYGEWSGPTRTREELHLALRDVGAEELRARLMSFGGKPDAPMSDFCPAFSSLYLPTYLRDPQGFGEDLFWICRHAQGLGRLESSAEAAEELGSRLQGRPRESWRTEEGRRIAAANAKPDERLEIIERMSARPGVEFAPSSCPEIHWAWDDKPVVLTQTKGLCELAKELAETRAFAYEQAATGIRISEEEMLRRRVTANWALLISRFLSEWSHLSEDQQLDFQRAVSKAPGMVDIAIEKILASIGQDALSCPAFSRLYLPEWAGPPDGKGRDIFWLCFAAREFEDEEDRTEAGARLLLGLKERPPTSWRAPEFEEIAGDSSSLPVPERLRRLEALADGEGIDLDKQWCEQLLRVWADPIPPGLVERIERGRRPSTQSTRPADSTTGTEEAAFGGRETHSSAMAGLRFRFTSDFSVTPPRNRHHAEHVSRRFTNEVTFCYGRFYHRRESRSGTVKLAWTIGPNGYPTGLEDVHVPDFFREAAECIRNRTLRWQYPESLAETRIEATYTAEF